MELLLVMRQPPGAVCLKQMSLAIPQKNPISTMVICCCRFSMLLYGYLWLYVIFLHYHKTILRRIRSIRKQFGSSRESQSTPLCCQILQSRSKKSRAFFLSGQAPRKRKTMENLMILMGTTSSFL